MSHNAPVRWTHRCLEGLGDITWSLRLRMDRALPETCLQVENLDVVPSQFPLRRWHVPVAPKTGTVLPRVSLHSPCLQWPPVSCLSSGQGGERCCLRLAALLGI